MKIHIIGGPGSGKTTLARQLSEELRIPHYDLGRSPMGQQRWLWHETRSGGARRASGAAFIQK